MTGGSRRGCATWAQGGGPNRRSWLRGGHKRLQQPGEGALQRSCQGGFVALQHRHAAQQQVTLQDAVDSGAVSPPPQDRQQLRQQLLHGQCYTSMNPPPPSAYSVRMTPGDHL